MIYGPWAILIGHCIFNVCYFDQTPKIPDNTFSSEYTCKMAGELTTQIGQQRTVWPVSTGYQCYNWYEEIIQQREKELAKRPVAPKPAPPKIQ